MSVLNERQPKAARDLRHINRVPCRIVVSHRGRSAPLGETRNISMEGLFVATERPLARGAVVPIALTLDGERELVADAEVVHRSADGMGLRFLNLNPNDSRHLRKYVVTLTTVTGTRDTAARLHEVAGRTTVPITDAEEISKLLSRTRDDQITLTVIPADRQIRDEVTLVYFDGEGLVAETLNDSLLREGEHVFVLHTVDFVSYSFETKITGIDGQRLRLTQPQRIHYSERRASDRQPAEDNTWILLPTPWNPETVQRCKVLECSSNGLSFEAPDRTSLLMPGTPLVGAALDRDGLRVPLVDAVVQHVRSVPLEGPEETGSGTVLRVGVAHGVKRSDKSLPISTIHARPGQDVGSRMLRWFGGITARMSYLWHRRVAKVRDNRSEETSRLVSLHNDRGQSMAAILDQSFPTQERVRAPLVIIVPGFGSRKESMSGLAMTMVHNFRRHHRDLAVLRLDNTNALGESHKDKGCEERSYHTLHYTISGQVSDITGALRWARNNPWIDPSEVILISVSFSSIATRHALTLAEASDVGHWIAFMGASDAQDAILHVTGHVDVYGNWRRGIPSGTVSLLGCLVDADHFCRDLDTMQAGTLEDARREMAKIRAAVTWVTGEHDAWIDPRRVADVMAVDAPGERDLITVDCGHVPRSSDEALNEFLMLTEKVWQKLYGGRLRGRIPSRGWLAATSAQEWDRVRQDSVGDRTTYWRDYLLGTKGPGFDILTLAPAYQQLIQAQVEMADVGGQRVLDLGAGTGNVAFALAAEQPRTLVCADLVPEALERLREKWEDRVPKPTTLVLNADGGPRVAMRRWIEGNLGGPLRLAQRIPGVQKAVMQRVKDRYNPSVHAILRGAPMSVEAVVRSTQLPLDDLSTLKDLNLLGQVVRGLIHPEDAIAQLERLPAHAIDTTDGLPFDAESFDRVVMSLFLSYLEHPADTLAEAHRILAPGGKLVISSMRRDADSSKVFGQLVDFLSTAPDEALPQGCERDVLLDAARGFLNSAAELFRLEEEGLFRFYSRQELEQTVLEAGFIDVESRMSFGDPPQAVVVACRKP